MMVSDQKPIQISHTPGSIAVSADGIKVPTSMDLTNAYAADYKQLHVDFSMRAGVHISDPTQICHMDDVAGMSGVVGKGSLHLIHHPSVCWTGKAEEYVKPTNTMVKLIKDGGAAMREYSIVAYASGYTHSFQDEEPVKSVCGYFPADEYAHDIKLDSGKVTKALTPGAFFWNCFLQFNEILKFRPSTSDLSRRTHYDRDNALFNNKVTCLTSVEKSLGLGEKEYTQSWHLDGGEEDNIGSIMRSIEPPKRDVFIS
jgi:hypothetical protein